MPKTDMTKGLSARLGETLPYLRRHARALTGSQETGDKYALAALEHVLGDQSAILDASSAKVGLFRVFFGVWKEDTKQKPTDENEMAAKAQSYLQSLTPHSRQALLLHSIEEFSPVEIGEIMGLSEAEADNLINIARHEMKQSIVGRIMVIEDEAMIAQDLQDIVEAMGHAVTGTAATRDQAVALAATEKPDLILSDIQLADGSSGIDAVNDILDMAADTPVMFITAFPERLLTGEGKEPAFVITKPYGADQIRSAVSQAMFFRSSANIVL